MIITRGLASLLALVFLMGCATIVSDSAYRTTINSSPEGATATIKDERGLSIHRAQTPFTTTLDAGDGYFSKSRYIVEFEKECYETTQVPVRTSLDGWYWGNILFGGLIGMLIVDPATGSMWKMDESVRIALNEANTPECTVQAHAPEIPLRANR